MAPFNERNRGDKVLAFVLIAKKKKINRAAVVTERGRHFAEQM